MPTIPHRAAGWRIEPPVSEPSATVASPAATAAAEPPLDPPGTRARSWGVRVGKKAEFSVDELQMGAHQLFCRNLLQREKITNFIDRESRQFHEKVYRGEVLSSDFNDSAFVCSCGRSRSARLNCPQAAMMSRPREILMKAGTCRFFSAC